MKRFLLFLLGFTPLLGFGQDLQNGYYRVQNLDLSGNNKQTLRYISIVDTRASITVTNVDLEAIYMLSDFEGEVAFNPATICYVTVYGNQVNLEGQGLNLKDEIGRYLNYEAHVTGNGTYRLYGSISGLGTKSLSDNKDDFCPMLDGKNRWWKPWPVDQEDHYFGIKPDIHATADDSYWSTVYAGFPMQPSASTTKMYTVCKVENGYAIIKEIEDGIVPKETPVLVRCATETPSGNKMTLPSLSTTATLPTNYLGGNWYCNDVTIDADHAYDHRNVKAYNPSNMRMLGLTANGEAAFVKSNIKYLPANKCYLSVSSSAPDVLKIITYEDYITGIHEIASSTTAGEKVFYDLQGRRVTAPSKGLYIVGGKKVLVK